MRGEVVMSSGFGRRLKELRASADMTQEAVARAADVSLATVAKLERGETDPTWNTVRALAKALGVSVADFDVADEAPLDGAVTEPEKPAPKKPRKK